MYKCLGCDTYIGWNGKELFSYTCPCGATILYDEETEQIAMPASVIIGISKGRALPHLDDLLGESDFTSPLKERITAELREKGFIWMRECDQCQKDGTLERKLQREKALAVFEAEMITKYSPKNTE